jgi:hypothetical protein
VLRDHDGGRGEDGAELAGGERVEGAEAVFEFRGGQAAQTKEAAKKILSSHFSLLRVAFGTARNEVAVGIGPAAGLWDDVVEDPPTTEEAPKTIKAPAAIANMNGLAPAADRQEIHLFEVVGAGTPTEADGQRGLTGCVLYLVWQKDFGQVSGHSAVHQAKSALSSETADRLARGCVREANATGETGNGKTELALAFETAMPNEVVIDHALGKSEAQAGHENVIELFPEECGIGFVVFHSLGSKDRVDSPQLKVHSKRKRRRFNTENTEAEAQRAQRN